MNCAKAILPLGCAVSRSIKGRENAGLDFDGELWNFGRVRCALCAFRLGLEGFGIYARAAAARAICHNSPFAPFYAAPLAGFAGGAAALGFDSLGRGAFHRLLTGQRIVGHRQIDSFQTLDLIT